MLEKATFASRNGNKKPIKKIFEFKQVTIDVFGIDSFLTTVASISFRYCKFYVSRYLSVFILY